MSEVEQLRAYIDLIRSRTCNTIEEWNLMIDAERKIEQAETRSE